MCTEGGSLWIAAQPSSGASLGVPGIAATAGCTRTHLEHMSNARSCHVKETQAAPSFSASYSPASPDPGGSATGIAGVSQAAAAAGCTAGVGAGRRVWYSIGGEVGELAADGGLAAFSCVC